MNRRFLIDAAERIAFTFLEAFAGAIVLAGAFDLSTAKAAAIAGVTAAAAVVKSLAAKFVGRPDSAALLPADSAPEMYAAPAEVQAKSAADLKAVPAKKAAAKKKR